MTDSPPPDDASGHRSQTDGSQTDGSHADGFHADGSHPGSSSSAATSTQIETRSATIATNVQPSDSTPRSPVLDTDQFAAGKSPPRSFLGVLACLGPGLIIAGSVVGSGELIATTKTGAEAGITLLWLIIIGCVIKVFVQIELGRYALTHGEATLTALDRVPGPRYRVNWIVWYWLLMMLVIQAQLGAIVGGVGQSMAIAFPIRGDYIEMLQVPSLPELERVLEYAPEGQIDETQLAKLPEHQRLRMATGLNLVLNRIEDLGDRGQTALAVVRSYRLAKSAAAKAESRAETDPDEYAAALQERSDSKAAMLAVIDPPTWDDRNWSVAIALLTIVLLYRGQYSIVQNVSTVLVVSFTFVTIGNVLALQREPSFAIPLTDILGGLLPRLPEKTAEFPNPLGTALATFGIIGVGAAELVAYPYWCLEKGYARATGPRTDDPAWAERARGWMRVMLVDSLASMVMYTVATVAFFFMGAAVLRSRGLNPEGMRMIGTLMEQYVPVFGEYARWLFLIGAFSVLYSTVLAANAGNSRQFADVLRVFGLVNLRDRGAYERMVRFFCVILPTMQLLLYWTRFDPVQFVILSGTMQALMLPMLGFAAIYHRYRSTDPRLRPTAAWDTLLWISVAGLCVAGGYLAWDKLRPFLPPL